MFVRFRQGPGLRSRRRRALNRIAMASIFVALASQAGMAQLQTGPIQPLPSPNSGKASITPMLSEGDRNKLIRKDSLGRPCLDIKAEARAQPATPNIFDHIVSVNNRCLQQIKVKLCYYKSDRCFLVTLAANARKETILGTFPSLRYFRYEYQEQP
jgi:hypothetical protein